MTFSPHKAFYISLLLILLLSPSLMRASDLEFDMTADTAYLPYKSILTREMVLPQDCSYPEQNIIEVVRPAVKGKHDGLLILSNNPAPSNGNPSLFNPRSFPGFAVSDDDPIKYVITNWKSYVLGPDSNVYVVGACHNDDSIFAFKLHVDTDSVEYRLLYARGPADKAPVSPQAQILYQGGFGAGGKEKIFLYIEYPNRFRNLFLLGFETLNIEWTRSVSSGINPYTFDVLEHPEKPRVIFTTGNSANGMTDSIYNDFFSYLTILDNNGNFLLNKRGGLYGHKAPVLFESNIDNEYFIIHYLDFETGDSTGSKSRDEYYLSRINSSGKILKSISVAGIPHDLWLMRYGNTDEPKLFVRFGSRAVAMYDCDFNLITETEPLERGMHYVGEYKIAGESDSVFVFSDGIYDRDLNKLMQFPFNSGLFLPIEYDIAGNVTAYVITEYLHYYIGYIKKRTNLELASVFYHRNRNYVLIFMTGLLVALVTTNIFRRRSQGILMLMTEQKLELEQTHLALKDAQAKIVSQERFEQAKDIAGGFAHEIRNALSPARNALSRLLPLTDVPADHKKTHTLAKLSNRGVIKALELTQQISSYTKLESLKNPEPVRLTEVVDDVLQSHEKVMEDSQIAVTWNPSDIPMMRANTDQLRIVITNLIRNAIDAMQTSSNRQLLIECNQSEDSVELAITDTGCGIPEEHLDRVFDFFYSTKPDTGTGIGLAISKRIIEMYDGTIAVDCSQSGQTTFTVRCPRIM